MATTLTQHAIGDWIRMELTLQLLADAAQLEAAAAAVLGC